nr:putative uncharacterized protein DDB_G0286901 [Lepeophtheirus salmonis]
MSPQNRNAKSILITGSDSGVGLEIVKSLANQAQGQQNVAVILAAAKNPNNSELNNIARHNPKVKTVQLDLEDFKNFGNFANEVQKKLNDAGVQHLSALINTAALHFNSNLNNVDAGQMIKAFSVNAVSPLMLIKALSKQLQNGAHASGVATAGAGAGGLIYSAAKAASAVQGAIQGAGGAANIANAGQNNSGTIAGQNNSGTNVGLNKAGINTAMSGPSDAISANSQGLNNYGLNQGHNQGQNQGQNYGNNQGHNQGQNQGHNQGQNQGHNQGQNQGQNYGNNQVNNQGQNQGQNYGNNQVNNQGQNQGLGVNHTVAHFGIGGQNSGAILIGEPGLAFNGMGAGGLVVNLTSGLSSISANNNGQFYAYRSSKSALNMITKTAAADLANSGVLVYSLNIDNAALDSNNQNAGANNAQGLNAQGNNINLQNVNVQGINTQGNNSNMQNTNNAQGYNANNLAQAIYNLLNNGNANLNGSLINVQGAPLLF